MGGAAVLKECDVVRSAHDDARGIVRPTTGLTKFRLDRVAPSAEVARFVDRYWIVSWDLRGQSPHTQEILAHPVVNIVFTDGVGVANGVATRLTRRVLEGEGRAFGVMFRPAGFRPFLGRAMSSITDKALPFETWLDDASAADTFFAARVPAVRQPSEDTTLIAERIAADPSVVRVEALAAEVGLSVRQLQRRFADHVGISPKAVIRRYRLYEAAERARLGTTVDWASLAAELGYSDQSHLTREFSSVFGLPPERYARAERG